MRPTARGVSAPWFAPRGRGDQGLPHASGGLTYRPGLDRAPAQPLRHGHSQAREGERVDPGPLGRGAEPGSRQPGSRGSSRERSRRGRAVRCRHRRCGGARGSRPAPRLEGGLDIAPASAAAVPAVPRPDGALGVPRTAPTIGIDSETNTSDLNRRVGNFQCPQRGTECPLTVLSFILYSSWSGIAVATRGCKATEQFS